MSIARILLAVCLVSAGYCTTSDDERHDHGKENRCRISDSGCYSWEEDSYEDDEVESVDGIKERMLGNEFNKDTCSRCLCICLCERIGDVVGDVKGISYEELAKIVEDTAGNAFDIRFGDESGTFFSKEMMSGLKAMIMGGRYIEGDKFNEVLLHQGMCEMAEFIRGKLLEQ